MTRKFETPEEAPAKRLEGRMQKVSLVVSLAGLGLMGFGLIDMLVSGDSFALPGIAVVALQRLVFLKPVSPPGLALASAGILLLGLLPTMRVLLALWLYVRTRDLFGALFGAVVLLELLLSIHLGR
ncbi:MAG: hypothetical protein WAM73_01390 [Desulfobacterales bacterium]